MPPYIRILERPEKHSYDELASTAEKLADSSDAYYRYASGWVALHASRIDQEHADEALFAAKTSWSSVITDSQTELVDQETLRAQSLLCNGMANIIRDKHRNYTLPERASIYQNLGKLAGYCLKIHRDGNHAISGLLTEVTFMQLIWRPRLTRFNAIPVNPQRDRGFRSQDNIDLRGYRSGYKGRFNAVSIQVKTSLKAEIREEYRQDILLLGGHPHLAAPQKHMSGRQRVSFTTECCQLEGRGISLRDHHRETIDKSENTVESMLQQNINVRIRNYKNKKQTEVTENQIIK